MKIKELHYNELQAAFKLISATVKPRYKKEGLSRERYVWDCFWTLCDSKAIDPQNLYTYLNDNHIQTALFKITGAY